MRLYLTGRMRHRQFYGFPAFDTARDTLTAMGHSVVSPADIDRECGFDGMKLSPDDPCSDIPEGFDFDNCVRRDIGAILDTDGICFIDAGWPTSKGSRAECAVAIWRGKRLFTLEGGALKEISHAAAETLCYHKGGLNRC